MKYTKAEMELIEFEVEDIVTDSIIEDSEIIDDGWD